MKTPEDQTRARERLQHTDNEQIDNIIGELQNLKLRNKIDTEGAFLLNEIERQIFVLRRGYFDRMIRLIQQNNII